MTQHIFVATDGSDVSLKAVEFASRQSAAFGVPLTIGHVLQFGRPGDELARMADVEHLTGYIRRETETEVELRNLTLGEPYAGHDAVEATRVFTLIGEELLRQAKARADVLGAGTVTTQMTSGDVADAILDMAQQSGADMIVVGHRGLGRLKSLILGSVAHKVVQHAECTVVSVR